MTGARVTGRAVAAALESLDVAVTVCDDNAAMLEGLADTGVATLSSLTSENVSDRVDSSTSRPKHASFFPSSVRSEVARGRSPTSVVLPPARDTSKPSSSRRATASSTSTCP